MENLNVVDFVLGQGLARKRANFRVIRLLETTNSLNYSAQVVQLHDIEFSYLLSVCWHNGPILICTSMTLKNYQP